MFAFLLSRNLSAIDVVITFMTENKEDQETVRMVYYGTSIRSCFLY